MNKYSTQVTWKTKATSGAQQKPHNSERRILASTKHQQSLQQRKDRLRELGKWFQNLNEDFGTLISNSQVEEIFILNFNSLNF